ncbi:thioredoxin [Dokdonia ponticola]|uniref:Thioredoxin n=1 Tax=Dokdonia ponticola TaxID=2041041 RepID=A0ABV9I3X2_9FLAO
MKLNRILALVTLSFITLASCNQKKTEAKTQETPAVVTTEETEEFDLIDDNGDPIIFGVQERATLEKPPYKKWFDVGYKEHPLDTTTVAAIKEDLAKTNITVFMGTWCEDSQREVPAFYKVLDHVGIDASTVKLITITEGKDAPENLIKEHGIEYVPTIIFEKEGTELGRIVEYSIFSMEKDIQKILNGDGYKHPYAE